MKILSFFILCFLLLASAVSAQINAELTLSNSPSSLIYTEGDIVEAVLKVWPIENADLAEFKKIEKTFLTDSFFVLNIENAEISLNNADVVEVKLNLVAKRAGANPVTVVDYKGLSIAIRPLAIKVNPINDTSKDYYILDQKIGRKSFVLFVFLGFLVFVIIFVLIKRKIIFKIFKEKNNNKEDFQMKYKKRFSEARTRADFESLYADRLEWISLIKEAERDGKKFFEIMEIHQYKKSWTDNELEEIKDGFKKIQRYFV